MSRLSTLLVGVTALIIAFALTLAPAPVRAASPAEGVTIEVLAEYPSKTPGVEKVLFRRMTLAPGATWSFTVPAQSLCHATAGELEVMDKTTGKTMVFKVGDRWDTSPGHEVTLTNHGSVDHQHEFYTMIVAK